MGGADEADILCIQRVLSGDRAAFSDIVRRYERRLRAFLGARVPAVEVDDLAQEVFLKAFRSLGSFRLGASFSPWLFAIAISAIANQRRRRAADERRLHEYQLERRPEHEDNAGSAELEAEAVRHAVSMLPETYRKPIELYYFAELSMEEVAKALVIGVEAAKTRIFRGRKFLADALEKSNREPPRKV